jgi:copper chaperone CopZ
MKQTRTLAIEGMTCDNCIRHVQSALRDVPGVTVTHVEVGSAIVEYDPGQVPEDRITSAVSDAGYPARIPQ